MTVQDVVWQDAGYFHNWGLSITGFTAVMDLIVDNTDTHDLAGANESYNWVRLIDGDIIDTGATSGLLTANDGYDVRLGTISANLAGGPLTKTTSGLVTLSGTNSYTGGTFLDAGILSVSSDSNLGNASGALNFDGGTLQITGTLFNETLRTINWGSNGGGFDIADADNTFTISQDLTGTGSLTKTGAGTLVLSGSNDHLQSVVQAGTLQIGDNERLADNSAVRIENGTFDLQGYDETVRFVEAYDGTIAGTGTLTADDYWLGDVTVDANLGQGVLWTFGSPTILNGTSAASEILVWAGTTLQLGDDERLNDLSATFVDGGTLDLQGYTETIGSLKGTGSVLLGSGQLITGADDTFTTFSGEINGTGSLSKIGLGIFELDGTNTFTGGTTVEGGRLVVNGSLDSGVLVTAFAELGGTGTINGTLENSGRILPGNSIGTLNVGDYISNAGSIYEVEANASGASDLIAATGVATINGGDVEVVAAGVAGDYARRTIYAIVSAASGVTGTYDVVTSNIAGLTPFLVYDDPNLVQLILTRNDIDFGTISGAQTPNQISVAAALTAASLTVFTGEMADALDSFVNNLTDAERLLALDELSPEAYIGLRDSALRVTRAGLATVGERMDSLHLNQTAGIDGRLLFAAATTSMTDTGPANAVSGRNGFSLWARPYRYSANQDGRNTFFGYHHDFFGVTVGADQAIGEHGLIGMLIGKSSGEVDYKQVTAQTDMESIYAGVYAALQNGDYALHAQAAWFKHEFDTIRSLTFNGTTARSAHDAEEIAVTLAGEYLGYKAGDWSVVPGLALEFSRYKEDGFTESGAGAFDLVGDAVSDTGLTSRVSLRANKAYTFDKTVLVPEVKVEWLHALGDVDRDATARFAGAGAGTFTVNGVDAERNSFVVGLGVSSTFNETSALYVSYDNEFASDYRSWGVSAGFKYSF